MIKNSAFKNCYNLIKRTVRLATFASLFLLIVSVLNAVLISAQVYLLQITIDELIAYITNPSAAFNSLYVIIYLTSLLLTALFSLAIRLIKNSLEMKVELGLTAQLMDKFSRIKYCYFESSDFHDLLQRMSDNPDKKISVSYISAIETFSSLVELVGIMVVLCTYSPIFAVIYLITLIFVSIMNFKGMNTMNSMFNSLSPEERRLNFFGKILSDKYSLYELRMYRAVDNVLAKYNEENKKVLNSRLKGTLKAQKFSFFANFGIVVCVLLLFVFMIYNILNSAISIGAMVALLSSLQSILSTTEKCSFNMSEFAQNSDIIFHINEFFELDEDKPPVGIVDIKEVSKIEFKNVSFRYPGEQHFVLKNVSFTIGGNEYVSVVGQNGAGKTTIIKLLCHLYEPTEGDIFINDINIRQIAPGDMHSYFAVMFQDFSRFELSVAENVALSDMENMGDKQRILQAINNAMATTDFKDIQCNLGKLQPDGVDISGGQWQKLALARTFFSPKKYIIMDEPTSSLDPNSEAAFYKQVHKLMRRFGGIIISHRLASAVNADKILVFDDGKLVQSGSHNNLLKVDGIYKNMFEEQSAFYNDRG